MTSENSLTLAQWHQQLQCLAEQQDLSWIIASSAEHYRSYYESGLSPEDELASLELLAEWRGCGCGG